MTKIQLSTKEMQLVLNPDWILTKHRIIEKVYDLFGNLSAQMQLQLQQQPHVLPPEVLQVPPKISKGEQYERLPYVVLDYPRFFSGKHVLAVRCFFWWGNYFSITLQVKGKFMEQWHPAIATAIKEKELAGFYYSYEGNEFSFNLEEGPYRFYDGTNDFPAGDTAGASFLKISYRVSFEKWDTAEQNLLQVFERFMRLA